MGISTAQPTRAVASNLGTIFEINSGGTLAAIHDFAGGDLTANIPRARWSRRPMVSFTAQPTRAGPAALGPSSSYSAGTLTTLHSFAGADGENPAGGLVQRTCRRLFWRDQSGGSGGQGTVFSLNRDWARS